jgi:hypothetical protein
MAPEDIANWIFQDAAQLVLRYSAYWLSLKGAPDVSGQATKTVHLPHSNMFTPKALQEMMVKASNGVDLI